MSLEQARQFIAQVPWRAVQIEKPGSLMQPHEYVIRTWAEVGEDRFWAFHRLVARDGYVGEYTARYRPDRPMRNCYLVIGEYCFWTIPHGAGQICRTPADAIQHRRLPEQMTLIDVPDQPNIHEPPEEQR